MRLRSQTPGGCPGSVPGIIRSIAVAAALLAVTSLGADQHDPRLDVLFEQLHDAPNGHAAASVESRIWRIWLEAPNARAGRLLAEARTALQASDYDAARVALDRLIEAEPGFAEARNQRAILMFVLRDYTASLRDIDETLQLEPRHFGALAGRGQCYVELDRPLQALAAFEAALEIHPWLVSVRAQIQSLRRYLETRRHSI